MNRYMFYLGNLSAIHSSSPNLTILLKLRREIKLADKY